MKVKSLLLAAAGLFAFGVTNAAWAGSVPRCISGMGMENVRDKGSKCESKKYAWNKNSKCKCPGYNAARTTKCWQEPPYSVLGLGIVYTCVLPKKGVTHD